MYLKRHEIQHFITKSIIFDSPLNQMMSLNEQMWMNYKFHAGITI